MDQQPALSLSLSLSLSLCVCVFLSPGPQSFEFLGRYRRRRPIDKIDRRESKIELRSENLMKRGLWSDGVVVTQPCGESPTFLSLSLSLCRFCLSPERHSRFTKQPSYVAPTKNGESEARHCIALPSLWTPSGITLRAHFWVSRFLSRSLYKVYSS